MPTGPIAGNNGYLKISTAPSPTNSVTGITQQDLTISSAMYDVSSMGNAWEVFIPGLKSGAFDLKLNYDYSDTNGQKMLQDALFNATLLYAELSVNNGANKFSFTFYVKDLKISDPVNNVVTADVTPQITGPITAS